MSAPTDRPAEHPEPSTSANRLAPWFLLAVPLIGGIAATSTLDEPVALGTLAVRPAPYAVSGDVFGLTAAGLVALNGRNPPRSVSASVPSDATDLSIDPAQRIYWAVGSTLQVVDLITGASESRELGEPLVDSVVLCHGLVGITSSHLIQWSPGASPTVVPLKVAMSGIAFGSDCDHVTAWNADGVRSVAIATGECETSLPWTNPVAAARRGYGWLVADSTGVVDVAPDGRPHKRWPLANVRSLCGVVADHVCAVTSDGVVWALP